MNKIGWCCIKQEMVLDPNLLDIPYLQDDMNVYVLNGRVWSIWAPEAQCYKAISVDVVPEVIKLAMLMLT